MPGAGTLPPTTTIDPYGSLENYDWQAFGQRLKELAAHVRCLLCGQIHALSIHAYPRRKVRSPAEAENVPIRIVSIICTVAKGAGRQYSKRILPPFVIPYCQIVRDGVLEYIRRYPDGRLVYAVGLELLGARDRRTIRRHVEGALRWVAGACLELARRLSGLAAYASLPQPPLGQSPLQQLEELAREADEASRRAGGGTAPQIPAVVYVHLVSVFERSGGRLAISLTYVIGVGLVPDTS